jgi:hypothetical protein
MRKFILIASMLAVAGFVACSSDESDDGAAGTGGGATGGTGGGETGGTGGGETGGTGGGETGGTGGGATGGTGGGETGGTGGGETGGTGGGETGGTGGGATGGTGGGSGQDCSTCGQANCPDEVTACLGATGCLQCLQGDDASCNAENEDEVTALGQCLMTKCEEECGSGGAEPDCDAPAVAVTGGSCVTVSGAIACNPVTNEGCNAGAGEACDVNAEDGFECFPAPNTQGLCEECSDTVGYCQGGMTCGGVCVRYCCDDTDCSAAGTCDKTAGFPGGVGVCLAN